jgi:hypothetical protein
MPTAPAPVASPVVITDDRGGRDAYASNVWSGNVWSGTDVAAESGGRYDDSDPLPDWVEPATPPTTPAPDLGGAEHLTDLQPPSPPMTTSVVGSALAPTTPHRSGRGASRDRGPATDDADPGPREPDPAACTCGAADGRDTTDARAVGAEVEAAPTNVPATGVATTGDREDGDDAQWELRELVRAVREADRWSARAVDQARRLDARRAVAEEGMTLDAALRLHTGAARGDVSMVLTAADVLATMPVTAGLFARGVFSWGHIRALTSGARRLPATSRGALDQHLGAHVADLERMDSDGRLGAIDDAVVLHERVRDVEDRAERDALGDRVILTPRLDGSGTLIADLAAEGFATVADRLDEEADVPLASPSPGDTGDGMARNAREGSTEGSRSHLLAAALLRIFTGANANSPGGVTRLQVIVDVDRLTDTVAGEIRTAVAGRPPRLVRRAIERLSCDAAYDVIVRDGVDLLAAQRYRPEVPEATRRAVAVRDGGCRFPACQAPASWCDVHHVVPREAGGHHAPRNLVLLCRRHHTVVHRAGWQQTVDDDGGYRVERLGRSWTTWPRHLDRLPPPGRAGPAPPVSVR